MFAIRTSILLASAMLASCTVLPRTGSNSDGGSSGGSNQQCSTGSTLCCSSQTTDDLLAGVDGTLQSVLGALLTGGAIDSCERIGSDTPCAVQPLCCQLNLASGGSFLVNLSCTEIDTNI
ncbi:hypothetical protein PC9H_002627 [Pleurotus ostreatus]|uniref:Hydrophobin n=1 Tax=Pleurotus ostreatus TaxID=5322 RepID=A0A8H6ZNU8_PLEOS|nr:uncharacterized protein PC9H_002627 [Pleurotus ostreatus]KAF7416362.1 hypothetical protein PC9H_002627 [Pleurotus ostreatus]KAJ8689258.1 hypothetical protein PTI98_013299 [Pleurotus ostreatus]